ncbi:MAG: hypothetical protein QM726_04320 [Chitinophagaceae bacterium]
MVCLQFFCICIYAQNPVDSLHVDSIPKDPGFGNVDANATGKEVTDGTNSTQEGDNKNVIGALLSYNFSGNKKGFSNLTPVIDYGWSKTLVTKSKTTKTKIKVVENKQLVEKPIETTTQVFKWDLSINPYAAGQIDVKDSASYLPGLMLPGVGGIKINMFLRFKAGEGQIVWSPINFGYKLISNFADSNTIISQHNLRTGIGYSYSDLFMVGIQYTYGWHNSTSESEKAFKKVFGTDVTDLRYLLISLQTKLSNKYSKTPTYFFAEWRGVLGQSKYKAFDNLKILTVGIRADMNIESIAPARTARRPQS